MASELNPQVGQAVAKYRELLADEEAHIIAAVADMTGFSKQEITELIDYKQPE